MSKTEVQYPCIKCYKEVVCDAIECSLCLSWCHRNCAKMSRKELQKLSQNEYYWFCLNCRESFPYSNINDEDFEFINCRIDMSDSMYDLNKACESLEHEFKKSMFDTKDNELFFENENELENKVESDCHYYSDMKFNESFNKTKGFSIIHFNCRSIKTNIEELKSYLMSLTMNFDAICVSESWLTPHDNLNEYDIDGYETFQENRSDRRGGGVMIYVHKSLKAKQILRMSEVINDIYECVTVEIETERGSNIIISCLYRTPGSNIDMFTDKLEGLLQNLNHKKSYYLVGDFNINLLNFEKHQGTNNFIDKLSSNGIFPLINRPTRITLESFTLIDNIYTNELKRHKSGVLINDISDHLPVFMILSSHYYLKRNKHQNIFKRSIREENLTELQHKLSTYNWDTVTQCTNVNAAYSKFIAVVKDFFDQACPLRKINSKKRPNQPWLNKGLLNSCKKQKLLYKRFLKHRTVVSENKYKTYKNKLTSLKRICKKEYFSKLLENNKDNVKNTWRVLNSLINKQFKCSEYPDTFKDDDGLFVKGDKNIANKFNSFFTNVGPKLASKIKHVKNKDIYNYLGDTNDNSMYLPPVNERDVLNTVGECKAKASEDVDNLSMHIIKHIINSVTEPFTHICNLSFENGVVPDLMKISKIVPLFKSGEKNDFTNYRPVALLPQFSKILEKLFCKRLTEFIDKYKLISDSQYGFRSNRSTSLAILDLIEELTSALDDNKYTIGVFIDLRKAFDTIDHGLLLKKMEHLGIRGVVNNWLSSYLNNRKQYVEINNVSSDLQNIICGVPQGSVLGPILFIMYINDICNASDLLKMVLFADDTNLFRSSYDLNSLCEQVSVELSKLNNWFNVNKLSLNVSKTNFIVFCGKKEIKDINIKINNENIERVYSTKFLGVIIDSKLTWKDHIHKLKTRLSKCISILYKCNSVIEISTLRTLYCSLFLPHINYCCEIWGLATDSLLKSIIMLQKRAIRIISKERKYAHTRNLFYNLKLLRFKDLVKLKTSLVMFKAKNVQLPSNLQNKFELQIMTATR